MPSRLKINNPDKDFLLVRASKSARTAEAATQKLNAVLDIATEELMEEIDDHPVSAELAEGPDAENTSGLLGGYGNLFSFMGFEAGRKPVEELKQLILDSISVGKKPFAYRRKKWFFRAQVPKVKNLEAGTPLPFEEGRSWLRGIERGISGLGFFIYSQRKKFGENSRSRRGIQSTHKTGRSGSFRNTKYLSPILINFYKKIGVIR